ncbi:ATP-binding protein [Halonotius sp. GCM10025705]|uniref:ATP-binding protein n=1 Tax=Halonotius sp. GCM10025705 TaxID=3252678 RepID=UPI00360A6D69
MGTARKRRCPRWRTTGDPPAVDETDDQLRITINDDGPGLPEDERQVLADGKEDPLVHGQGLGLWLTYWIITTLDGEITVPKSQQGTTIEIRLPVPSAPA